MHCCNRLPKGFHQQISKGNIEWYGCQSQPSPAPKSNYGLDARKMCCYKGFYCKSVECRPFKHNFNCVVVAHRFRARLIPDAAAVRIRTKGSNDNCFFSPDWRLDFYWKQVWSGLKGCMKGYNLDRHKDEIRIGMTAAAQKAMPQKRGAPLYHRPLDSWYSSYPKGKKRGQKTSLPQFWEIMHSHHAACCSERVGHVVGIDTISNSFSWYIASTNIRKKRKSTFPLGMILCYTGFNCKFVFTISNLFNRHFFLRVSLSRSFHPTFCLASSHPRPSLITYTPLP